MGLLLSCWLFSWFRFVLRPASDEQILRQWIPRAKAGMTVCNLAVAASVWIFMPVSGPELRSLMIVLYAWYLVVQFVAATQATQVLNGAVVLVLGSQCAWLLTARPAYGLPLAIFLGLFGATLILVRRFVRDAVVQAATAREAADEARRQLDAALGEVARERDAKTHFIQAASHDLQQPLQAAALFLDRVRPSTAPQEAALGGLRAALGAARALVAAMLEHLKLEGGVVRPHVKPLMFGEVLDRRRPPPRPISHSAPWAAASH
jgi:signal transduction histidine kinase